MPKTPYSNRKASEKTLLEGYAGQALVGLLAHREAFDSNDEAAEWTFEQAEAMIKESEKRLTKAK